MKEEKVVTLLDTLEAMRQSLIEQRTFADAALARAADLERENGELKEKLERYERLIARLKE